MLIRSGSLPYLCRVSQELARQGYVSVGSRQWSDKKWTFMFKKKEELEDVRGS